ncbi:hypothetical protein C8J57DRAFT_1408098 [Mycena rebaudengoi]|nr:hypothetical protein C8J57DRAFT_1408098 [Mycena rebaudengoi]
MNTQLSTLTATPFFQRCPWRGPAVLSGSWNENAVNEGLSSSLLNGSRVTLDILKQLIKRMEIHDKTFSTTLQNVFLVNVILGISLRTDLTPQHPDQNAAVFLQGLLPIFHTVDVLLSVLDTSTCANKIVLKSSKCPDLGSLQHHVKKASFWSALLKQASVDIQLQKPAVFSVVSTAHVSFGAYSERFSKMFKSTSAKTRMIANVESVATVLRMIVLHVSTKNLSHILIRDMATEGVSATLAEIKALADSIDIKRFIRPSEIAFSISPLNLLHGMVNFAFITNPATSKLNQFWCALGTERYTMKNFKAIENRMWMALFLVMAHQSEAEQAIRDFLSDVDSIEHLPQELNVLRFDDDPADDPTTVPLLREEQQEVWYLDCAPPASSGGANTMNMTLAGPKGKQKARKGGSDGARNGGTRGGGAGTVLGMGLRDRNALASNAKSKAAATSIAKLPQPPTAMVTDSSGGKRQPQLIELIGDNNRLQEQFKDPLKRLDLQTERPRSKDSFTFSLYPVTAEVADGEILPEEVEMRGFQNSWDDEKRLMTEVVAAQRLDSNNQPLFLGALARDPNPNLDPEEDDLVSILHRCILFTDVQRSDLPTAFDAATLSQYRELDSLTEIQDVGLRTRNERQISRVGRFSDLLRDPEADGLPRTLNALSTPLRDKSMVLPPAWSIMATHEQAFTSLAGWSGISNEPLPMQDLRWMLFCTGFSSSWQHVDVIATFLEILLGMKIVVLATKRIRQKLQPMLKKNLRGDWCSRHAFDDWDGAESNQEFLEFEIFPLRPNQVLKMRPGTIHYIISPETSIAKGEHTFCSSEIQPSVAVLMANVLHDDAITNASHTGARWILLRIFKFQVHRVCNGENGSLHVPDLTTKEGSLDILFLHHFIILYLIFHPWSYPSSDTETEEVEMMDAHFTEIHNTQELSLTLVRYVEENFHFSYPNQPAYTRFLDVVAASLGHMAFTLITGKDELWSDSSPGSFTVKEFAKQIALALKHFDKLHGNQTQCGLRFEKAWALNSTATLSGFTHWMPWTEKTIPWTLKKHDAITIPAKRTAQAGSSGATQKGKGKKPKRS